MTDCLANLPQAFASVAPGADATVWLPALEAPMRSSGLATPNRAAMFLGQCAEESGGFSVLIENLNYSADGLRAEWPSHFAPTPGMPDAERYAHQPDLIANYVYANRMGNGPPESGDGWTYRGAGIIQGTGRQFWTDFGASVHLAPAAAWIFAQSPHGAVEAACWYWLTRGQLLAMSDAWDIEGVTQRINGGLTNLSRRGVLCTAARAALAAGPAPVGGFPNVPNPDESADALMAVEQTQLDQGTPT